MTIQSGQKRLTGFPASGAIHVDNGGATLTYVPCSGGTVPVNGATPVAVANPAVTAGSIIAFTLKTAAGTVGAIPTVATITPGTGFTVVATALDTSVYNYVILG